MTILIESGEIIVGYYPSRGCKMAEGQEHFIFNGKTSLLDCFCRCICIISNAVKCGCERRILFCMVRRVHIVGYEELHHLEHNIL